MSNPTNLQLFGKRNCDSHYLLIYVAKLKKKKEYRIDGGFKMKFFKLELSRAYHTTFKNEMACRKKQMKIKSCTYNAGGKYNNIAQYFDAISALKKIILPQFCTYKIPHFL